MSRPVESTWMSFDTKTNTPVPVYDFCCECNARPTGWFASLAVKAPELYANDPAFIERAFGDDSTPADTDLLHILTTVIACQSDYRTYALFRKFFSMMSQGYVVQSEPAVAALRPCLWERPLMGIVNMVAAIELQESRSGEDASIMVIFLSYREKILNIIKRDLAKLLPMGAHGDHLRLLVIKLLMLYAESSERSYRFDDQTMELILTCWTHMSFPNRRNVNEFIRALYGDQHARLHHDKDCANDKYAVAISIIGVDTFKMQVWGWLRDPRVTNEQLWSELATIAPFLVRQDPCARALASSDIPFDIIDTMRRQMEVRNVERTYWVLDQGLTILAKMAKNANDASVWIAALVDRWVFDIALCALTLFIRYHEGTAKTAFKDTGFYSFFAYFEFALDRTSPDCEVRLSPPLAEATKQSLEKLFFPHTAELARFRACGSKAGAFVFKIWVGLCVLLRVTKESVQQGWWERRECGATACPRRFKDGVKTRLCKGCRRVGYCSVECQKAHWKEHKARCLGRQ